MQNKGAIRVFAILLALVSFYQLIFTYQTKEEENKAKEIAKTLNDPQAEINYLDSVANEPVYKFLFGLKEFTYKECKEKEINFGLDLKGGMNLILEVKVADILKALSNYNSDPTFNEALKIAEQKEKNSSADFITLFYNAFKGIDSEARLAAIFNTVEMKGRIDYNSSNEDVLKVIREESQSAIDNSFNILSTRIDRFGVVQPNIQKLEKAGRVLVELPGVKDPQRVRKLLQGSASLEFWETYEISEIAQSLIAANQKVVEIEKAKETLSGEDASVKQIKEEKTETAKSDDTSDLLKEIESDSTQVDSMAAQSQKSLFSVLMPSQSERGALVGMSLVKDTSKVNGYLKMDQVKALFPKNLKFMWSVKPMDPYKKKDGTMSKEEIYRLYAIKVGTHDGRAPLEGDVITSARAEASSDGAYEVNMRMNAEGANVWARLTKKNINRCIAVVLDGYVYSAPNVNTEITGGSSSITGGFSVEEAKDLANILKSGKLPAPARIVEDTVVGPSLGQEAVNSGFSSFIWAFVVVLLYMIFYYGFKAGIISDIALIANMFFILGVLASFGAVLTLPGIAGIVLTIGMSVDANVLIYERIKEEVAAGKGVKLAITDGYKNAFSAIIDSNVTTFLTGLILFLFGTGPIKGFATTLMIGIATSFFSAIYITRLIYERLLTKPDISLKFSTKLTEGFMKNAHIKFLEKKKIFFVVSGVLILLGIGSLATQGLKAGIDFSGGRTYVVRFDETVSSSDIQKKLADEFEGAHVEVKTFGGDNQVRIATNYLVDENGEDVDNQIETKLYEGLKSYLGDNVSFEKFTSDYRMSSQKVGPTIATDIKTKAYYSIAFSLLVIFLYILIRFKNWEYGLGALLALVHDVLITVGFFSLLYKVVPFSLEIDQAFIAAILTVIGYSINDTVVVFDRIREFLGLHPKRDRNEVVDEALNSTISRTVNTSLTTFVVLLVIFLFGGETIQGFVFALLIGVVVGTYSSLFVATPIAFAVIDKRNKSKALKGKK